MILLEETQVADAALPITELRQHLRLGTGFAEDDLQMPVLASFLRAAMAAVEGRTGKALLARDFVLTLDAWRNHEGQSLPVAPVQQVTSISIVDAEARVTAMPAESVLVERNAFAPVVRPKTTRLPAIPPKGRAEIRFRAGYGDMFADVPADLGQAVLLLAAHYYEYRDETALGQGCMPFGVTSLLARYAPMRLGMGA